MAYRIGRSDRFAMVWTSIDFGEYVGKTLPHVVLKDPDWVFGAAEKGQLAHIPRVSELIRKAQSIRIPNGLRGPRVADYIAHSSGKLSHLEVDYAINMIRDEDVGVRRMNRFDLSYARRLAGGVTDKTGSRRIVDAVRRFIFVPRGWVRMTASLSESFFDDDANFNV